MSSSVFVKKRLASFLDRTGFIRVMIARQARTRYVILMYHRVLDPDLAKVTQSGMYVDVATFEHHAAYLKKHFTVVPLIEVYSHDAESWQHGSSQPKCVLTFDDGWLDFYENAYPILEKYELPATVFLATDFIGTSKRFWTDHVARIIDCTRSSKKVATANQSYVDKIANNFMALTGSREKRLEEAITMLKRYPQETIDLILNNIALGLGIELNQSSRAFISWGEAKEMQGRGLVTFGSHTSSHKMLTLYPDEEVVCELTSSRDKLKMEGVVSNSFISFCYPNGSLNDRILCMVKDAGYQVGVTTQTGWNNRDSNILSLHRIGIHQDMTSTSSMYGCKMAGLI